jgi:hypothetical protein
MLVVTPVQGAISSAHTTSIQETLETTGDVLGLALSLGRAFGARFRVSQSRGCVIYACALLISKNGETL